jgi:hypothetical protein
MDFKGAGTAIMVAIAALLWFLYFVPTWMARREYLDTERTATRLQQTLRIMAETSELPDQVRVEVRARDAARHERVLRAREHRADVLAARAEATVRASTPAIPRPAASVSVSASVSRSRSTPAPRAASARRRRRRAHRLASVLIVAATVTIGLQMLLVVMTGVAPGAVLVFALGAALGVVGVTLRHRLDARSAQKAFVASPGGAIREAEQQPAMARQKSSASGWTPVPVPPPLYLHKPQAQPIVPAVQPGELVAQLRAAALAAEEALRAAHAEPEVWPIRPVQAPVQAPAAPSRWAAMGRLAVGSGGQDAATPDLDEVLRRRRNAG